MVQTLGSLDEGSQGLCTARWVRVSALSLAIGQVVVGCGGSGPFGSHDLSYQVFSIRFPGLSPAGSLESLGPNPAPR